MGGRRLRNPVQRIKVGLHGAVEIVGGKLCDIFTKLLPCGVDHQNIEAAKITDCFLYEFTAPGLVGDVAWKRDRHAAFRLDEGDDFFCIGLFFRQVGYRDVSALSRKGDGDGTTNAGVAAGDQSLAPRQLACAFVSFFAVIWKRRHVRDETRHFLGGCRKGWARILAARVLRLEAVCHLGLSHR